MAEELRPKIVKLIKMIGGVAGAMNKIEKTMPEYYALDGVVTDDMADVALCLGLRQERTLDYIQQKCGKSMQETQKLLDQLCYTGVVKTWKDKKTGKDLYFVNIFAPGILEMMVNNREQLAAHPEIGRAFEEYTRKRLAPMAALFPEGMAMMRVVPVESAIKDLPGVQPWKSSPTILTNTIPIPYPTAPAVSAVRLQAKAADIWHMRCASRWVKARNSMPRPVVAARSAVRK